MSSYEGREPLDGLRAMRAEIEKGDAKTLAKIANAETALARLGAEINNIHKRMQRPGAGVKIAGGSAPETEQAAARTYLDPKAVLRASEVGGLRCQSVTPSNSATLGAASNNRIARSKSLLPREQRGGAGFSRRCRRDHPAPPRASLGRAGAKAA